MKTVRKQYRKRGNWTPEEDIELGAFGLLKRNGLSERFFHRMGNVKKFGIDFDVRPGVTPMEVKFQSAGDFKIEPRAKGDLTVTGVPFAKAGASVRFGGSNMVYVRAHGCYTDSIEDIDDLGNQIVKKYENGTWERKYVVVTEVTRAEAATVILTTGKDAEIDIVAEAGGLIGDITDTGLGLNVVGKRNVSHEWVAREGLKLMVETWYVNIHWFRDSSLWPSRTLYYPYPHGRDELPSLPEDDYSVSFRKILD